MDTPRSRTAPPRLWALRGIPSAERDLFSLSDSVKGGHEASQSGMGKFLTKHPEALRIMVGGASSGACGVEEFLRDDVSLFWYRRRKTNQQQAKKSRRGKEIKEALTLRAVFMYHGE